MFSFGVVMAEVCSKVAPWKSVDEGFVMNPDFPSFPEEMPQAYVQLAFRSGLILVAFKSFSKHIQSLKKSFDL